MKTNSREIDKSACLYKTTQGWHIQQEYSVPPPLHPTNYMRHSNFLICFLINVLGGVRDTNRNWTEEFEGDVTRHTTSRCDSELLPHSGPGEVIIVAHWISNTCIPFIVLQLSVCFIVWITSGTQGKREKKIKIHLSSGQVSLCFSCPTLNSSCPLDKLERTERTSMFYGLSSGQVSLLFLLSHS